MPIFKIDALRLVAAGRALGLGCCGGAEPEAAVPEALQLDGPPALKVPLDARQLAPGGARPELAPPGLGLPQLSRPYYGEQCPLTAG